MTEEGHGIVQPFRNADQTLREVGFGNLKIATSSSARLLSGDPLSSRSIVLQRKVPGAITWASIGTLSPNGSAGSYGLTISPPQTYDYRLLVNTPSGEGLLASSSPTVRIVVGDCVAAARPNLPVRDAPVRDMPAPPCG